MKVTTVGEERERIRFANLAARHFEKYPKNNSYTNGQIEPGELIALRWGLGNDCVLVLKLDDCFQPVIYSNIIQKEEELRPFKDCGQDKEENQDAD